MRNAALRVECAGPVAQWSEQGTHNPSVEGSIPSRPTEKCVGSAVACRIVFGCCIADRPPIPSGRAGFRGVGRDDRALRNDVTQGPKLRPAFAMNETGEELRSARWGISDVCGAVLRISACGRRVQRDLRVVDRRRARGSRNGSRGADRRKRHNRRCVGGRVVDSAGEQWRQRDLSLGHLRHAERPRDPRERWCCPQRHRGRVDERGRVHVQGRRATPSDSARNRPRRLPSSRT